jgi:hypothetical protein
MESDMKLDISTDRLEYLQAEIDAIKAEMLTKLKKQAESIGYTIVPIGTESRVTPARRASRVNKYSTEAKRKALRLYREGHTANSASRETGVSMQCIWTMHSAGEHPDIPNLRNP